ncbi:antitoxin RelB2 [Brevundimonas intermedia]|uniref:Antitoxin RelB2 n=1 Tax=Brevundimonas intermedia TaxID=74315 RepID=A0ABQ5TBS9_9CAUL|nr:antitoxin [Brevundimonas intermedia]GLK50287.1 antitoxin RelB2 [Brevundimonas intermedia]
MARPEPSIFNPPDAEADERSLAEAEADFAAGRVVPHEEVSKWLLTWGTPEEGPPPASWGLDD